MAESSILTVATNVFTSPAEAFVAIKERPRAWVPLILLLAGACVISVLYVYSVDLPWLMEQQIDASGTQLTDAQREQALERIANMTPGFPAAIGAIGSVVSVLIWFGVLALYYTGVSFATGDGIKYKQWFGLLAWSSLPGVLGILASLVNLLTTDARFMLQDNINPLSFGSLFSIDSEGASTLQRILLSRDITFLWSLVLMMLGYQQWTQRSLVTAAAVVLGPLALIVGVSALIALS
jgi:hypothetical protein